MLKPELRTRSVPSLDKGLNVFELIAASPHGLTLSDLVRRCTLPRSSIYSLILTLERRGYLRRRTGTHRFTLGGRVLDLFNHVLAQMEIRHLARPHLYGLMQATKLTVHLAVMEQNQAALIEKVKPPDTSKIASWIGRRMDIHCTGLGKALIANLDEQEIDRLIREHGLPRHNENTIRSSRQLKAQLEEIRKRKYAIDDEEDEIGLRCIGAPILNGTGKAIAAISLCGAVSRISSGNLPALAKRLTWTASEISRSWKEDTV